MVNRLRWDLPVVGAAWALLLCAATLLAAGALYGDAVAVGSLRETIRRAPPAERGIQVLTTIRTADADALDGPVRAELTGVIGPLGGLVERIAVADVFTPTAVDGAAGEDEPTDAAPLLVDVASYEGIADHAQLVAGAWPQPGRSPVEAALSVGAAESLGLGVGDRLALEGRTDPERTLDLVIAGVWRPEPDDPYWIGGDLEFDGHLTVGGFTTVGPVVIDWSGLLAPGVTDRLAVEWRATPAVDGFRADRIEVTRAALRGLDLGLRSATPTGVQLRLATRLPDLLAEIARAITVSWSGILVLLLQFAMLAGYALVLVAGMLADRRRAETALVRSRGATSSHVALMAVLEAIVVAVAAGLVAPWLALAAVRWLGAGGRLAGSGILDGLGLGPNVVAATVAAVALGALALVLPVVLAGGPIAGVRAALARTSGRTLGQRLGLDMLLFGLAGLGLWQLRLYGAPITRQARGALGVDPLLVAAPAIGLLAGALLATRLLPRLAELSEILLVRGRGLVGATAGRALARRPLRTTRSALLLMLAVALGTFATGYVATWERSQFDQAAHQAGAEIRVVSSSGVGRVAWRLGSAYRAIDGIAAVMPVERTPLDAGRAVRGGVLLALDPAAMADIIVAPPAALTDGPGGLAALSAELLAGRPADPGVLLPDGIRALRLTFDSHLVFSEPPPGEPTSDPASMAGLTAEITVLDGDGRVHRFRGGSGVFDGDGQALEVPLGDPAAGGDPATGAGPARPLRLLGLSITFAPPRFVFALGRFELRAVLGVAPSGSGVTAIDLGPGDADWRWSGTGGGAPIDYRPPAATPWRIEFGFEPPAFPAPVGGGGITTMRLAPDIPGARLSVVASSSFLEAASLAVGDRVAVTSLGTSLDARIVGSLSSFPTLDPAVPFLIADGATLVQARLAATGRAPDADEWWFALRPGLEPTAAAAVVEAVRAGPDGRAVVTVRDELEAALLSDPLPLGLIGILGLGALAAMVFATIGFAVGAAVSAEERSGEYGILRALGLSAGQLAAWLAAEQAVLLGLGLAGGLGLGFLLAWLVLPFASLTRSGEPPVPDPVILVPTEGLAGIALAALVVLVVTTLVLRRELLAVRVTDVLRGRDE